METNYFIAMHLFIVYIFIYPSSSTFSVKGFIIFPKFLYYGIFPLILMLLLEIMENIEIMVTTLKNSGWQTF